MKENIKRISVIGGSGTGKTVLADNLSRELNLPVCHIDGIHHLANWKERDKNERDKIILDFIKKKRWVIDGTYHSTLYERIKNADLVIYLDYSSISQVKGVIQRYIKGHGKEKKEIPGCKERLTPKFLKFVILWRKKNRPVVIKTLEKIDKEKLIIFKSRRELNKWYKKEFNKKIEI